MTDIYSYIMEPFTTYAFTNVTFHDVVTLHVPKGTYDKYNHYYPWYHCTIVEDLVTTEPGDVNCDGKVNVSDVTALVNMILGVIPKLEDIADLTGDGKVNVSDVTALINIILGVH